RSLDGWDCCACSCCWEACSCCCGASWAGLSWAGACCWGCSPPPEPSPIMARSAPTSTVSSSSTRIFSRTPAMGEGTSVSTLSVDAIYPTEQTGMVIHENLKYTNVRTVPIVRCVPCAPKQKKAITEKYIITKSGNNKNHIQNSSFRKKKQVKFTANVK